MSKPYFGQKLIVMPAALPCCQDAFVDGEDHRRAVPVPDQTRLVVVTPTYRALYGNGHMKLIAKVSENPPGLSFSKQPGVVPFRDLYGLEATIDTVPH